MKKPVETYALALGCYVQLPNVEASSGRTVRFRTDCPLNCRAVYTPSPAPHHVLKAGSLGTLVALHPENDIEHATASVRLKHRVRLVTVPQSFLELMPLKHSRLSPLSSENVSDATWVEACLPFTVNGRAEFDEMNVHHVISAGVRGRIVRWSEFQTCEVAISGRRRTIKNVPFSFLEAVGVGEVQS